MTVGSGIAIASMWFAVVLVITYVNSDSSKMREGFSPIGVLILIGIAAWVTVEIAGAR